METLLVLLLVWPGLTTRLVPGPATISLDGGYRDILVTIQPHICREGRGQKACARQTLGNLKVLNTCYLRDDNFPGTVVTHHTTHTQSHHVWVSSDHISNLLLHLPNFVVITELIIKIPRLNVKANCLL